MCYIIISYNSTLKHSYTVYRQYLIQRSVTVSKVPYAEQECVMLYVN